MLSWSGFVKQFNPMLRIVSIAVTFTVEMMRHEYLHDLVLWHKSKRRLSHAEWKPHLDGHLSVGARLLIGDIKLTLDCH
jgi:hypothetical protein